MAETPPVSAARSVSAKIRSFSPAVNVRRFGRSDSSGLAAAGAGTTVGLRPSSVPAPAAACASTTLLGMTTRQFSYALKSKLPGDLCLIIIGTEGAELGLEMQSCSKTTFGRRYPIRSKQFRFHHLPHFAMLPVFAMDGHGVEGPHARFGLKVTHRRLWCPFGSRPPWVHEHQYHWFWLYAAVEPVSGTCCVLFLPHIVLLCHKAVPI